MRKYAILLRHDLSLNVVVSVSILVQEYVVTYI